MTGCGAVKASYKIHECTFTRTRRAHDCNKITFIDDNIDFFEHRNFHLSKIVGLFKVRGTYGMSCVVWRCWIHDIQSDFGMYDGYSYAIQPYKSFLISGGVCTRWG